MGKTRCVFLDNSIAMCGIATCFSIISHNQALVRKVCERKQKQIEAVCYLRLALGSQSGTSTTKSFPCSYADFLFKVNTG